MSETTEKVAEGKSIALSGSRFTADASFAISFSHVRLPAGMPLEAVLKPEFWVHVAGKMRPDQRVLIDAEDGAFSAQVKVHAVAVTGLRPGADVSIEWRSGVTDVEAVQPADAPGASQYRIHYIGKNAKWRISRVSDNETVSEGHASKAIAQAELERLLAPAKAA